MNEDLQNFVCLPDAVIFKPLAIKLQNDCHLIFLKTR